MNEEPNTVIQRCLDALQEGTGAEPFVRDLLERAVGRLRLLCATLLRRSYPRLTQPPLNLETDDLLGGVVAGLLTALRLQQAFLDRFSHCYTVPPPRHLHASR